MCIYIDRGRLQQIIEKLKKVNFWYKLLNVGFYLEKIKNFSSMREIKILVQI